MCIRDRFTERRFLFIYGGAFLGLGLLCQRLCDYLAFLSEANLFVSLAQPILGSYSFLNCI